MQILWLLIGLLIGSVAVWLVYRSRQAHSATAVVALEQRLESSESERRTLADRLATSQQELARVSTSLEHERATSKRRSPSSSMLARSSRRASRHSRATPSPTTTSASSSSRARPSSDTRRRRRTTSRGAPRRSSSSLSRSVSRSRRSTARCGRSSTAGGRPTAHSTSKSGCSPSRRSGWWVSLSSRLRVVAHPPPASLPLCACSASCSPHGLPSAPRGVVACVAVVSVLGGERGG